MLLFRSEEDVAAWCARTDTPRGEVVPFETIWRLAQAWYGNRMHAAYRGRTPSEAEAVLAGVGLDSAFWKF